MSKKRLIALGVAAGMIIAAVAAFLVIRFNSADEAAKRTLNKGFRGVKWGTTLSAFRDRFGRMSNGELVNMSMDDRYCIVTKHDEDLDIFGVKAIGIRYFFPRRYLFKKDHACSSGICPDNHRLTSVRVHFDNTKYACKDIAAGIGKELGVDLKPGLLPETAYELNKKREKAEKEGKKDDEFPGWDSYLLEYPHDPEENSNAVPALLIHLQCRAGREIELITGNPERPDDPAVRDFYLRAGYFDKEAVFAEYLAVKETRPWVGENERELREVLNRAEGRAYMWRTLDMVLGNPDHIEYLIDTMQVILEDPE